MTQRWPTHHRPGSDSRVERCDICGRDTVADQRCPHCVAMAHEYRLLQLRHQRQTSLLIRLVTAYDTAADRALFSAMSTARKGLKVK